MRVMLSLRRPRRGHRHVDKGGGRRSASFDTHRQAGGQAGMQDEMCIVDQCTLLYSDRKRKERRER